MKLNIEELAREAGRSASLQYSKAVDDGGLISWEGAKMEAFARLIVERCAVECAEIQGEYLAAQHGASQQASTLLEASSIGANACAAAIRKLLEDE